MSIKWHNKPLTPSIKVVGNKENIFHRITFSWECVTLFEIPKRPAIGTKNIVYRRYLDILFGSIIKCKFRPIPLTLISLNRLFARIYGLFRLSNECSSVVSPNLTRFQRRCYLLFTTNNKTAASACLSTKEFIDSLRTFSCNLLTFSNTINTKSI